MLGKIIQVGKGITVHMGEATEEKVLNWHSGKPSYTDTTPFEIISSRSYTHTHNNTHVHRTCFAHKTQRKEDNNVNIYYVDRK